MTVTPTAAKKNRNAAIPKKTLLTGPSLKATLCTTGIPHSYVVQQCNLMLEYCTPSGYAVGVDKEI